MAAELGKMLSAAFDLDPHHLALTLGVDGDGDYHDLEPMRPALRHFT
jgi:hypothetical protein